MDKFVDTPYRTAVLICDARGLVEGHPDGRPTVPGGPRETGTSSSLGECTMTTVDRVRMAFDTATIAAEYPHLEDVPIEALYGNLMDHEHGLRGR